MYTRRRRAIRVEDPSVARIIKMTLKRGTTEDPEVAARRIVRRSVWVSGPPSFPGERTAPTLYSTTELYSDVAKSESKADQWWVWHSFDEKVIKAWDQGSKHDSLKWKALTEPTFKKGEEATPPGYVSSTNYNMLAFDDDPAHAYSRSLGAAAEVPSQAGLPISVPVRGVRYASPVHYVEAMRVRTATGPPKLYAGWDQDACARVRANLDSVIKVHAPDAVRRAAQRCDTGARSVDFYSKNTVAGRFWFSLWVALWARCAADPSVRADLKATNKRLLIYVPSTGFDEEYRLVYGVVVEKVETTGEDKKITLHVKGCNAVGVLYMIMRGMGDLFDMGDRPQPAAYYESYVRPILEAVYNAKDDKEWPTTSATKPPSAPK